MDSPKVGLFPLLGLDKITHMLQPDPFENFKYRMKNH